jgi:hypothetical protein
MRPSSTLQAVIHGRLSLDQCPQWCRSWLSFYVYKQACYVLDGIGKQEKIKRLETMPPAVKPLIQEAAKSLHLKRKKDTHKV